MSNTETKTPVTISKKSLTEDINNSYTQAQLMEKYNIPANSLREILKEAGLKIKKTRVKRFILADDTTQSTTTSNTVEVTNELN